MSDEVTKTRLEIVPPTEEQLDEETQRFIAQSLTDVDLFASYGLTQKAIGLLEAVLRRAPRHVPTLEKLLDFVLGAGDDRRTAELAAQLENIHKEAGDVHGAELFGELRRRFQRAAGLSDSQLAGSQAEQPSVVESEEAVVPPVEAEPKPVEIAASPLAPAAGAQEVHEVDLSDEWASVLDSAAPPEAKPAAKDQTPATPAIPVSTGEVPEFEVPAESVPAEEHAAPPAAEIPVEPATSQEVPAERSGKGSKKKKPKQTEPTPAPELEVEQSYELVLEPEPLVPAHEQKPTEPPALPAQREGEPEPVAKGAAPAEPADLASNQFLADLAQELEQLGLGELTTPPSAVSSKSVVQPATPADGNHSAAPPPEPAKTAFESGPLKEVFEEFRAELGEMGAEEEDLETHYNLGIAFREMGLLEEAISEFQKVAQANERGRSFRYTMQCCTLLGLSFMQKGQPAIAAHWYERALRVPDIDPESALALRYDLGVAQESAGELDAARKSFSQVYAVNIDYRDVGERIAALQKTTG